MRLTKFGGIGLPGGGSVRSGPSGPFFAFSIFAGFYQESGLRTPSMEISGSKSPRGLIESPIGWKKRIFKPKTVFCHVSSHKNKFLRASPRFVRSPLGMPGIPGDENFLCEALRNSFL